MKRCQAVLFCIVMLMPLSVSAASQEQNIHKEKALDDELNWLQAEAEADFVSVATKTKMAVAEAPSIVSVITEEQIKNSGAKSFAEVLRQVAGFHVFQGVNYPDFTVGIRGFGDGSNSSVKLMINNHSLEHSVFSNGDQFFALPITLIKKIEIIRGPGSALYGNSAMNGVINIITKDAESPTSVSAGYGSFDTWIGTGQVSYTKKDFGMFLFADGVKTDGDPQQIESDLASVMFPPGFSLAPGNSNEDYEIVNLFSKFTFKKFYLTGLYTSGHREPPVGIGGALTDSNNIRNKKLFAETGYEGPLTDKISLTAKAYFDYYDFNPVYEAFNQNTTALFGYPPEQGTYANPRLKTRKFGAEAMVSASPTDSLEFIAGALWEYSEDYALKFYLNSNTVGKNIVIDGIDYPMFAYFGGNVIDVADSYPWIDPEPNRTVSAGYLQGTWNLTNAFPNLNRFAHNLALTGGIRYDNYDDVGDTLNPRLGIVYAPNEKIFFKMLYGTAFRAPLFNEMYVRNNPFQIGNENMKPETIETMEFLAGVHLTKFVTASVNFFNIKKEDTIRLYRGVYSNWGEFESRGIEGEIRVSYDKHKYGYVNITWQKAEDITRDIITDTGGTSYQQPDYPLGMHPEIMANLGVNYDITKHINANASVNYIGSIDRIGKMQFTPDPTDPDGTVEKTDKRDSIDSYTLVNVSITFGNFDFAKGWEFQLTGFNIFNADHRNPEVDGNLPNDLPRWDRHFMGKITYTF